jgi:hypothetical protein
MDTVNNVCDIIDPQKISTLGFKLDIVEPANAHDKNSDLKTHLINQGWGRLTKIWEQSNQTFYNAELFNFEGLSDIQPGQNIRVSKSTDYKSTVGLRYWREDLSHKSDLLKFQNTATKTLSALVIIKDQTGKVLWRVRNSGDWPKSLEMPGGFVRTNEPDLRQSLANRLQDDLKIDLTQSNLKIIRFLHLKDIYECMLIFELIIDQETTKEIEKNDSLNKLVFIDKGEFHDIYNQKDKVHPKAKLPFHYPSQSVFKHVFNL